VRKYALRRLALVVPVVVGSTFLIFAMVFVLPGDPIRALSGFKPQPPAVNRALRDQYNLNDPLLVQYVKYLFNALHLDFGRDFAGREVSVLITQRLPRTARLAFVAMLFEVLVGTVAALIAALRRDRFADTLVMTTTITVVSIPVIVLAPLAQYYLGVKLGWFPIGGVDRGWYSYLLPGMVLGSLSLAYFARLLRAALVENLRAEYVHFARAKGLPPRRVVGIHAMRNSLLPVLTFFAVDIGALLGGSVVVETVFNIPGIGLLFIDAARAQETPVIIGVTTFLVLVYSLLNLAVDLLHAVLDPRIRLE
jgi:ABC-type dipeptide/oligopeptide/nickel transport system permease component